MTSAPEPLYCLRKHEKAVNIVRFVDDQHVVTGGLDGTIVLWDLESRRPKDCIQAHTDQGVLTVIPRAERNDVITQGRDGLMKIWDLSKQKPVVEYFCGSYTFTKATDERWKNHNNVSTELRHLILAPCSEPSMAKLLDTRSGTQVASIDISEKSKVGMCMSLALFAAQGSTDGVQNPTAAIGYEDGTLAFFDIRSSKFLLEAKVFDSPLLTFDVDKTGRMLPCGSSAPEIQCVSVDYNQLEADSEVCHSSTKGGYGEIRIRPDQRIFASGGWDKRLRVFHLRRKKPLAVLKTHTKSVHSLDFGFSSGLLVSAGQDARTAVWNIYPPST